MNLRILVDEVFDETGVRNSVLAQVAVPYMNSRIPFYTEHMWGGKHIEINPDNLDVEFEGNTTLASNSTGQGRKVDLIFQFVLNDLAVATGRSRIGFLAIDEVLDKVDDSGIYGVVAVLKQKSSDMAIFMVSHRKYASAIVSNCLTFYKRDGTTRLLDDARNDKTVEMLAAS